MLRNPIRAGEYKGTASCLSDILNINHHRGTYSHRSGEGRSFPVSHSDSAIYCQRQIIRGE